VDHFSGSGDLNLWSRWTPAHVAHLSQVRALGPHIPVALARRDVGLSRGKRVPQCPFLELRPWMPYPQKRLMPLLLDQATSQGGEVLLGREVMGFEEGDEGVRVEVRDASTGETTTFETQYLVAADGAGSGIRRVRRM
jgi:2-polyprenyl-6-methoxyphenol hydroxylase-like FAD-dependent oxidoreductase